MTITVTITANRIDQNRHRREWSVYHPYVSLVGWLDLGLASLSSLELHPRRPRGRRAMRCPKLGRQPQQRQAATSCSKLKISEKFLVYFGLTNSKRDAFATAMQWEATCCQVHGSAVVLRNGAFGVVTQIQTENLKRNNGTKHLCSNLSINNKLPAQPLRYSVERHYHYHRLQADNWRPQGL